MRQVKKFLRSNETKKGVNAEKRKEIEISSSLARITGVEKDYVV